MRLKTNRGHLQINISFAVKLRVFHCLQTAPVITGDLPDRLGRSSHGLKVPLEATVVEPQLWTKDVVWLIPLMDLCVCLILIGWQLASEVFDGQVGIKNISFYPTAERQPELRFGKKDLPGGDSGRKWKLPAAEVVGGHKWRGSIFFFSYTLVCEIDPFPIIFDWMI